MMGWVSHDARGHQKNLALGAREPLMFLYEQEKYICASFAW